MEESKKSFFKNKKIMIPVIALISIILLLSIILSGLFMPRKLSFYVHCKAKDIQEVYILDIEDHRYDIPIDEYTSVVNEIKQLKIRPVLSPYKTFTEHSFYIVCKNETYKINGYYMVGNKHYPYKMIDMEKFMNLLNQYIE